MPFRPYLAFAGNCREAFTHYHEVFGGELVLLTRADTPPDAGPPPDPATAHLIMHAALRFGDELLMGGDDPTGGFEGGVSGMCCNYSAPDVPEAGRVFAALAEGGEVQMPMSETFFAPAFGMCVDRFGTPWRVMVDGPPPA
jgi:PhnB protein